jgi:hypothetical protein
VEHLAHVDAPFDELLARRLDVLDDEHHALDRPGCGVRNPRPKWIEAAEPGGVNWTMRTSSPGAKSASRRQPSIE